MIKQTLELLGERDWLIGDEDINIAKGMYELPSSIREMRISNARIKKVYGIR